MARNKEMKIAIKIGGQVEATLKNAISQATRQIGAVSKAAVHTTKAMAAGTAAAAAAIGAASVKVGKEFETAMSSAAATADATPEQYKKMEEAARAMGRATSKTAAESAAALEYMALAGWDVDTSISALPSVLKMSEASGMELARTSDLITDSMSALGVSIEGLPGYLDVAAKAQNKSNQTAEQLMEAYLGVGGTMNNLSVPITESATALGVLANRGIKGSEAGTALNAVMVNLTTGTGQAGEMMGKLGISAFDSSGKFIGLENTLQQVNAALSGCTDEERNAALAAIGGKQHVDALNDLMAGLNTTNEKGITEWAALTKELEGCDGALEKMAARKIDNLEGDLAILNSAVSDLGISIYKDMNTPLRGAVQLGTQMADTLSKRVFHRRHGRHGRLRWDRPGGCGERCGSRRPADGGRWRRPHAELDKRRIAKFRGTVRSRRAGSRQFCQRHGSHRPTDAPALHGPDDRIPPGNHRAGPADGNFQCPGCRKLCGWFFSASARDDTDRTGVHTDSLIKPDQ